MQQLEPTQIALLCCIRHVYTRSKDTLAAVPLPSLPLLSYLLECIYELNSPPTNLSEFEDRLFALPYQQTASTSLAALVDKNGQPRYKGLQPMLTNKQHAEAVLERCAMIDSIRKTFIDIGHRRTDGLVQLFNEVKVLLPERDAEEVPNSIYARPPIERRSPLGTFIRRIHLNYQRKAFDAVLRFIDRLIHWSDKLASKMSLDDSISAMDEDLLVKDWSTLLTHAPTVSEGKGKNREDTATTLRGLAYDEYMNARNAGHLLEAQTALRRFHDFRVPGTTIAALRSFNQPRALYSLACFHTDEQCYLSARSALEECLKIARQVGDRECLSLAIGLKMSLDGLDPDGKTADEGEVQIELGTSTHQLRLIQKGLADGQPVHDLLIHLYRAKALVPPDNVGKDFEFQRYRKNHEAVAAELWKLLDSPSLADVHWSLAAEVDLDVEVKYTAIARESNQLAYAGKYDQAMALLLSSCIPLHSDPIRTNVRAGLTKEHFKILHAAFWQAWRIRAKRGGYQRIVDRLARIDASQVPKNGSRQQNVDDSQGSESHVRSLLEKAKKLIDLGNPSSALQILLKVLTLSSLSEKSDMNENRLSDSSGKGLVALHLLAQVMLAEVEIQFKASSKGESQLIAIWPRIMASRDLELRAYAQWIRARCMIANAERGDDPRYANALGFLAQATDLYTLVQANQLSAQLYSDMAVVFNYQGDILMRDTCSQTWLDKTNADTLAEKEDALLKQMCEMEEIWTGWSVAIATLHAGVAEE